MEIKNLENLKLLATTGYLSHPHRALVLSALLNEAHLCVSGLVEVLALTRCQLASNCLRSLHSNGFVQRVKLGGRMFYSIPVELKSFISECLKKYL